MMRKGFGLLEVLLATAIFIVVIGSMVTLNQMSVRNAVLANHRTQAYNLAEDALESIRELRDTNWIDGPDIAGPINSSNRWLAMVLDCTATPSGTVRRNEYKIVETNKDYALCFDPNVGNTGRFAVRPTTVDNSVLSLGTGDGANFVADPSSPQYSRKIRFETVSSSDLGVLNEDQQGRLSVMSGIAETHAIKVIVTVTWKDFDKDWSADISTILTNWKGL